jgi:hypothetical protein
MPDEKDTILPNVLPICNKFNLIEHLLKGTTVPPPLMSGHIFSVAFITKYIMGRIQNTSFWSSISGFGWDGSS